MPNLCRTLLSLIFTCICAAGMAQDFQQHTFNIYFKTNSDEVSTASMAFIRQQLLDIGTSNIREIRVKGHADSDATDSFNIKLSQRRAQNTYQYFLTQGVPESLISSEAFGESVPMSDLKSLNRRAEIILVYDYATSIGDLKSRKFVIKGRVSNFNTLHPMACTFVIEDKKLNVFKSTGSSGKFLVPFVPGRGISLTFSKDGFLNYTAQISPEAYKTAKGDTIYLDIALKPVEVYEKIVFEKIFFFSDSDSLRPESKPDLDKLTNILKADKSLFVEIQGHMNCPVSRPMTIYQKRYNHELSHKRAKAIYKYLINMGIPAGQLTFKGMSNFYMIYPEPKTEAEADKNKRVEVWKLRVIPK